MAIFSNGKATFAERLSNVKAMFQTAHNQASAFSKESSNTLLISLYHN